jgi:carboxymethylenebutenolidase
MAAVMSSQSATLSNIDQARAYLTQYALAPVVGAVGWCLGGAWVLEAGLELGARLDALVMYYGRVVLGEARLGTLNTPLLGLFAELDDSIPVRDVQTFRNRLRELGKEAQIFIYPGAAHAFANPSGGAYDEEAAADAWEKTLVFLAEELGT